MTDDLVKRLRDIGTFPLMGERNAIADALEAQEKRIIELEAENKHLEENFTEWLKEYRRRGDRVKELEAALKECADDLEAELIARYGFVEGGPIYPAENKRFQRDMAPVRVARAALGENDGSLVG